MSDFYEESTPYWSERDDRMLADELEHDRMDAAHERFLDIRDRDLPMRALSEGPREAGRVATEAPALQGEAAPLPSSVSGTQDAARGPSLSVLELDLLPVPAESTGLCVICRHDMALPESDWCAACAAEVFGDTA